MNSKSYFNELVYSNLIEIDYWNWCEKIVKTKCKEEDKSVSSIYSLIDKIDLSIANYQSHYKSKIEHFQEKFKELKDEIDKEMKEIIIIKQAKNNEEYNLKRMIDKNILFHQNNEVNQTKEMKNDCNNVNSDIYNVIKESGVLKEYKFINTKQKL